MTAIIILIVLALAFLIFGHGYNYVIYTLLFIAALIAVFSWCPRGVKIAVAVLTALGFIYFCIAEAPVLKNRRTDAPSGCDYIVVLGAAVRNSKPTLSLENRMEAACRYMAENPGCTAIVSGGQGADEDISEAECMRRMLVDYGIDESRIIMEDRASSTMENLQFSKEIILSRGDTLENVAIVSSPYHLYRAKYMASKIGYIDVKGVAGAYGYPVHVTGMFIREAFAVTHMWIFGE